MGVVLQTVDLVKTYEMGGRAINAVDGISLTVNRGDFISIMGPSGSGKTTLLSILGCIDRPTTGSISVSGKNAESMTDRELDQLRLRKIGFVFQKINLVPILSALENVELPLEIAGEPAAQRRKRAMELIDSVGLAHRAGHRPGQLSGGEQQRIGIARALANSPDVILADEPTGNLDSATAESVMDFLRRLNSENGQTLILVTHDVEVGNSARRRFFIRDGKIDFTQDC